MPTARFCTLIGRPARAWRRWQAKARADQQPKGPWPQPVRDAAKDTVVKHATAHTAWGHRKIWAMTRRDGVPVSASTVMRALRDENLLQAADYQRERRKLAAARKAAFLVPPTGPNQVWQLDFLCRRRHKKSYADLRTMPTFLLMGLRAGDLRAGLAA
jgi:hypothetical protein